MLSAISMWLTPVFRPIATRTPNLVLNQAIILAVLGTALLLPRLLIFPVMIKMPYDNWMGWAAAFGLLVAVLFYVVDHAQRVSWHREQSRQGVPMGEFAGTALVVRGPWVQVLVVFEILLAFYLGSLWIWRHLPQLEAKTRYV